MASFHDLMSDHSVKAIRKATWALPGDHLELPPIVDGARGPWCTLYAFDGELTTGCKLLVTECEDAADDWQEYISQD